MPRFMNGAELQETLRNAWVDEGAARLAVAFWGRGAADLLGMSSANGARLICNLSLGGTCPDEVRTLQDRGAEIRHLPTLHAKLGIVGDVSFLGSSNMSRNGFGSLEECSVVYRGERAEIAERFETIWSRAVPVDESILTTAEQIWRRRRTFEARRRIEVAPNGTLLDLLRCDPKALDLLPAFVVTYEPSGGKALEQANTTVREGFGVEWECYEGWEELPDEGFLFEFTEVDDQFKWNGIWRRDLDVPGPQGFQAAQRVYHISGRGMGNGGPNALTAALRRMREDRDLPKADVDGARLFPLGCLAAHLREVE